MTDKTSEEWPVGHWRVLHLQLPHTSSCPSAKLRDAQDMDGMSFHAFTAGRTNKERTPRVSWLITTHLERQWTMSRCASSVQHTDLNIGFFFKKSKAPGPNFCNLDARVLLPRFITRQTERFSRTVTQLRTSDTPQVCSPNCWHEKYWLLFASDQIREDQPKPRPELRHQLSQDHCHYS